MLLIPKIQQQQPKKKKTTKKLYLVEMKDEHRVFSFRVTLFQPLPLIHIFSRDSLQRTALTRFIFYTYFSAIIRYFLFSIYFIAIAVCLSRFVRSFIVVVFFSTVHAKGPIVRKSVATTNHPLSLHKSKCI